MKVRNGGGKEIPLIQGKEQWLCFAGAAVKRYGKLEVVKQEMARVNVDILGISEIKWTGMGEFNSDRVASCIK